MEIITRQGTVIPFVITLTLPSSLTINDIGLTMRFYVKKTTKINEYVKSDGIIIDDNNIKIMVETKDLGSGEIMCDMDIILPDGDMVTNERPEMVTINTGINIK